MATSVNECIPYYEDADRVTYVATAAITGKRFLKASADRVSGPGIPATAQIGASDPVEGGNLQAAHASASGASIGVSSWDAAIGDEVDAIAAGIVPVTADGTVTVNDQIMVGASGKAKTYVPPTTTTATPLPVVVIVGTAVSGATDGNDAQIRLRV